MSNKLTDIIQNTESIHSNTHCVCGKEIDPENCWYGLGKRWCCKEHIGMLTAKEQDVFIGILNKPSVFEDEE